MVVLAGLLLLVVAGSARAAGVPAALPGAPPFPEALRAKLTAALARRPAGWKPRTRHLWPDGSPRYTNRLALESSPYLLQHAHNPVNWYAWGDEAFAAARALNRPVLLSIGYSTCHWCHVMEEESFDDVELAKFLNAHFVAVKVDREARPDVDAVYLSAVEAMGQGAGWPLNVWLTPDRKPFFGGTYFPPQDERGRPGLRHVLEAVAKTWEADPARVERQAASLAGEVKRALEGSPVRSSQVPDDGLLRAALAAYAGAFDPEWGGLRGEPKFPASLPVRLLLRLHRRSGDPHALEMATLTLEKMAAGGIHDHVGGGFHRYSTDARWLVPHFEKMLYDNALLAMDYIEGWQATGRADFAAVARETLDYVAREMTAPGGGFFSAMDADSPGPTGAAGEGRFYTWTPEELGAALGPKDAALAADWFGVTPEGDLDGRSVLHTWKPAAAVAAAHGLTPKALRARIARVRERLYQARSRRAPPLRDDKVLAAWNGLMISAFAKGALAFDVPAYARAATRAAEFVLGTRRDGRLRRVSKDGRASGPAFLEDYAFLIAGLLDLYEAVPDPRWISQALALQAVLDARYADAEGGAYFRTPQDAEPLLAREKPMRDDALPSGNAVEASNLLRLAAFTGKQRYEDRAFAIFSEIHDTLAADPASAGQMLMAVDFALDTSKEVLLVVPPQGDPAPLLDVFRRSFVPNRIFSVVREGAPLAANAELVPLLRFKKARAGRVTAYVCENRTCKLPTSDPHVFAEQLAETRPWSEAPKKPGARP